MSERSPATKVAVVDIGTNSMRLLIMDGEREIGRWVEVTGLGRGVDRTGRLDDLAIDETMTVLEAFGKRMDRHRLRSRVAIATSASRDAANRDRFFDLAEKALGVRPTVIDGRREAALAFAGATFGLASLSGVLVSDIGGGSTEFVAVDYSVSVDIGSVRLTERLLPDRPASPTQLDTARAHVLELFKAVELGEVRMLVGVAGTWTSLGAISLGLDVYERSAVHGSSMSLATVDNLVGRLSRLTVEETAAIPSLDPKRAPVILAGAVIARCVAEVAGVTDVVVSEHDTLDGAAAELLALR